MRSVKRRWLTASSLSVRRSSTRDNILNATMGGMCQAVSELELVPNLVLVDGNRCPPGPGNAGTAGGQRGRHQCQHRGGIDPG